MTGRPAREQTGGRVATRPWKGARTNGLRDRSSAAQTNDIRTALLLTPYAGVSVSRRWIRYAPLPNNSSARNNAAISGSVGAGTGIISAVLADGPCRSPTPARVSPRPRTSNVYSVPISKSSMWHLATHGIFPVCPLVRVVVCRVCGRPRLIREPVYFIPDEPAGAWPGVMGGEARRGGGRWTMVVIRHGARRADDRWVNGRQYCYPHRGPRRSRTRETARHHDGSVGHSRRELDLLLSLSILVAQVW